MSPIATEFLFILALLLINGLLAMSEIAIVSARKARLHQLADQGDAGAAAALQLAEEPTRFLSTVQVGITLVGILAGAFGGATVAEQIAESLQDVPPLAPYGESTGLAIVVAGITFLSLIVGELVPKRLALNAPERIASMVARPMGILAVIAGPVVTILTLVTEGVLRVLGVRPSGEAAVTEEEVRILIAQGTEAGVFEEVERELVESAFELGETRVNELMTHRPFIIWLDVEDPPEASWQVILGAPYRYYPVCRGELDKVIGVLSVNDLMASLLAGEPPDIVALAKPPLFLPEQAQAFKALAQFKQVRPHVALVVDEHGGVSGLLTPTDLLKGLVGKLAPIGGGADAGAVRREDGSWLLDGTMSLEEAATLLGKSGRVPRDSEDEHILTLGGLAMARLGRIPAVGDRFSWWELEFEIVDMDGRRVDKVLAHPTGETTSAGAIHGAST